MAEENKKTILKKKKIIEPFITNQDENTTVQTDEIVRDEKPSDVKKRKIKISVKKSVKSIVNSSTDNPVQQEITPEDDVKTIDPATSEKAPTVKEKNENVSSLQDDIKESDINNAKDNDSNSTNNDVSKSGVDVKNSLTKEKAVSEDKQKKVNATFKKEAKQPFQKQATIKQPFTKPEQNKKVVLNTQSKNSSKTVLHSPIIIKNNDLPPISYKREIKSTGAVGVLGGYQKEKRNQNIPQGFVKSNFQKKNQFNKKPLLQNQSKDKRGQVSTIFKAQGSIFAPPQNNAHSSHQRKQFSNKKQNYHQEEEREFEVKEKKRTSALENVPKKIDIMPTITVGDLARKMNLKAGEIITKLFSLGQMATINEMIDSDTATIIASEYGCDVHIIDMYEETVIEVEKSNPENLLPRPPIVTVMGHVDHGKTKLLDAIRNSDVVSGEFGGITQHIGAYKIKLKKSGRELVFIDTPGHAAFTMMRARGAKVTDVVILVVAATEGVMPQTVEAIDHAKAANVPIVVALNKCDLPDANPDKTMQQLSEYGLMPEEWGGNTQYQQISALKKEGIYDLLEKVLLQSDILELKADPTLRASGVVLESRIDQGRGVVATVLVKEGTLHKNDNFVAGIYDGHIRTMWNDRGEKVTECGPSTPVEITGMDSVPLAGDPFQVTEDDKIAKQISTKRKELERQSQRKKYDRVTLDNVYDKIKQGEAQEFNIIIKGDVQGSVEALEQALLKLTNEKVHLNIILARAGAIIENDVNLAIASTGGALIIGFNVRPTAKAATLAAQEGIEIRKYNVIYDVVDDVKSAMEGLLSPVKKEVQIGTLEVRETFKVPNVGIVAGCMVKDGKITRKSYLKVIRDNIEISKSIIKISSLKRFKEDVKDVLEGFECGVGLENFQDLKVGDILESYDVVFEKQKLDIKEERI